MNINQYLAFEEDCDWSAFVFEQPELYTKAWNAHNPNLSSENPNKYTAEYFKEQAMHTLEHWHKSYFV